MKKKAYLGDGVYAEKTEIGIRISTERRNQDQDIHSFETIEHYVYLGPREFAALFEFLNLEVKIKDNKA